MLFHKTCWSVALALAVLFIGCSLSLPARDDGIDGKELTELGSPGGTIHEEVVVGASLYVRKKPERSRQLQQSSQTNANRQIVKREIRVQQAEGYDQSKPHNDKSSVGATEALKRSKGASTGSSKTTPAIARVESDSASENEKPTPRTSRSCETIALLILGRIAEWIKDLTERPPRRSSSSNSKTCTINRPSSVVPKLVPKQSWVWFCGKKTVEL